MMTQFMEAMPGDESQEAEADLDVIAEAIAAAIEAETGLRCEIVPHAARQTTFDGSRLLPKRERLPARPTPDGAQQKLLLDGMDCLPGQLDLFPPGA